MSEGPKLRRRLFRYSLRFLLVLVVIVAVPLAWKVNRVRNQRLIVAEVESLGGQITWAHYYGQGHGAVVEWPGPKWLRDKLGDDYFAEVAAIDMRRSAISDDVLARFSTLPRLKFLCLDANKLTDAGFARIAALPRLTELALYSDQMTDGNLRHFQNAAGLTDLLCLSGEKITDAGLRHIGKLTQLRTLLLQSNSVTDRGVVELYGMRNLYDLELNDISVTPEAVEKLRKALPKCQISVTGWPAESAQAARAEEPRVDEEHARLARELVREHAVIQSLAPLEVSGESDAVGQRLNEVRAASNSIMYGTLPLKEKVHQMQTLSKEASELAHKHDPSP